MPPTTHSRTNAASLVTLWATSCGLLKMPIPMTMPTMNATPCSTEMPARGDCRPSSSGMAHSKGSASEPPHGLLFGSCRPPLATPAIDSVAAHDALEAVGHSVDVDRKADLGPAE